MRSEIGASAMLWLNGSGAAVLLAATIGRRACSGLAPARPVGGASRSRLTAAPRRKGHARPCSPDSRSGLLATLCAPNRIVCARRGRDLLSSRVGHLRAAEDFPALRGEQGGRRRGRPPGVGVVLVATDVAPMSSVVAVCGDRDTRCLSDAGRGVRRVADDRGWGAVEVDVVVRASVLIRGWVSQEVPDAAGEVAFEAAEGFLA